MGMSRFSSWRRRRRKLQRLCHFIRESNLIEGIIRRPTAQEVAAYQTLLTRAHLTIHDLECFVDAIAPGEVLRDRKGLDVMVGWHLCPSGGPQIRKALDALLAVTNGAESSVYDIHRCYLTLHPFTDGNGRSARALWLWMTQGCNGVIDPGFLRNWYYESLQQGDREFGFSDRKYDPIEPLQRRVLSHVAKPLVGDALWRGFSSHD